MLLWETHMDFFGLLARTTPTVRVCWSTAKLLIRPKTAIFRPRLHLRSIQRILRPIRPPSISYILLHSSRKWEGRALGHSQACYTFHDHDLSHAQIVLKTLFSIPRHQVLSTTSCESFCKLFHSLVLSWSTDSFTKTSPSQKYRSRDTGICDDLCSINMYKGQRSPCAFAISLKEVPTHLTKLRPCQTQMQWSLIHLVEQSYVSKGKAKVKDAKDPRLLPTIEVVCRPQMPATARSTIDQVRIKLSYT